MSSTRGVLSTSSARRRMLYASPIVLENFPEELVKQLYFLPIETQILYKPQEFREMICKAANSLPPSLQGLR